MHMQSLTTSTGLGIMPVSIAGQLKPYDFGERFALASYTKSKARRWRDLHAPEIDRTVDVGPKLQRSAG